MKMNEGLPFKVGQVAEAKSFKHGYRGAWFRCKIKDIRSMKGNMNYFLEYFDFPDEKVRWTQLYQKPFKDKVIHLMVRPSFPPVYRENEVPDFSTITEVIAVVNDIWQVGDLADSWTDGCYWSGRITQLDGEEVKIKLPEPPRGEGGDAYDALCEDLRPSLEWSPKHGWTVPTSEGNGIRPCVRLIKPVDQETGKTSDLAEEATSVEISTDSCINSVSSLGSEDLLPPSTISANLLDIGQNQQEIEAPNRFVASESGDGNTIKRSSSDSVSNAHVEDVFGEATKTTGMDDQHDYDSKKMRLSGTEYFNSSFSDTIESSIMDLEELACRIKWLQRVHQFGLESTSAMTPSWKFLENRISFNH